MGGPFTLTDHMGNRVTEKSWPQKYLLVYFGFTHCPDICPRGLSTLTEALNKTSATALEKIQPVFITVDPARDTAEVLKEYMKAFHPKFLALTGSEAEIDAVKKAYRVYAEDPSQNHGQGHEHGHGGHDHSQSMGMINHSAFTYLMAPDGTLAHIFGHDATSAEIAKTLNSTVK